MLKIQDLSKSFYNSYLGENVLFKHINLEVKQGEFIIIIGSNGTGKSTLLNIISGLVKETSGNIFLEGNDLTKMPEHKRTENISRVFQNPSLGTCPTMTVRENLSLALNKGKLINLKNCLRYKTKELEELLNGVSLDLKKLLDVEVKYLSGGQRQALSLIMAGLSTPKLLLLDEHTAALDPKTSKEIMELTQKIVKEKNITTIMITHNLKDALAYGTRLIMLHKGEAILDLNQAEKKKLTIENILKKFEYAV
ncbi:ABC transporter ATP-binding protein [Clostridium tagluense]|uniref:ABC transporter ATP-binding protein n=1 Tax=Clostridium tagluense TaxID=360422 RepID=UPI001CF52AAD|nr:ATP-binding cassette domain-containing protein [Clostridium tagluense]MCB2298532.1 ATP-binding cassette domain-containing protein [Clostridium tagluense]